MAPPTRTIPRIFLDSSDLFAAAYSATGTARELLQLAIEERVGLVLSQYVLDVTQRNLLRRVPQAHPAFLILRDDLPYELSVPSQPLIADMARIVVAKDAPIIAAARVAQASIVATYDRKDLLSKRKEILDAFDVTVATRSEILAALESSSAT